MSNDSISHCVSAVKLFQQKFRIKAKMVKIRLKILQNVGFFHHPRSKKFSLTYIIFYDIMKIDNYL